MISVKEAYRDFLNTPEGATLYGQFKQLLYSRDDSLVQWLNTTIFEHLPAARLSRVRICDIGGGRGDRVSRILEFLHAKFGSHFDLDFVEQSAVYAAAFDPAPLGSFCKTRVHHALFETLKLPVEGYDLLLLIHSIFAFENGPSTEKALSLRGARGNIVVVSNASNSFLRGLKRLVDEGYPDERFEIDQLERTLRKLGIRYQRKTTNTEWALEEQMLERDLDIILKWISFGRYSSFSKNQQSRIREYVESQARRSGSRVFFREQEVALVVPPMTGS